MEDFGKLLLRITCAGLLALHGFHKAFVDIEPIKKMVAANGLPGELAYGAIVGELIAPLFMIVGFKTRIAALVVVINMLLSILIAHRDIAFQLNEFGGWVIELNVLYLVGALVVAFIGPGKISFDRR
jgi:putative oxidoreductase